MEDSRLRDNIKQNLEAQGINISETEVDNLYTSVLANISEILNKGDIFDISDFGSFWRKSSGASTATFFKPSESILERINSKK